MDNVRQINKKTLWEALLEIDERHTGFHQHLLSTNARLIDKKNPFALFEPPRRCTLKLSELNKDLTLIATLFSTLCPFPCRGRGS